MSALFLDLGVSLRITAPDLSLLQSRVGQAVEGKIRAGLELFDDVPDVLIAHRDADSTGGDRRRAELTETCAALQVDGPLVPVIPVRMTEAWLLLDPAAIRTVAGNPRGKAPLELPRPRDFEGVPDPKALLRQALLAAADATGRRRDQVAKRFPAHRRQLLERLDRSGPVSGLPSFQALLQDVEAAVEALTAASS
ncbi:DUF4276 family protein [Quadrisphaera sp. DSM 44207]|uniref:DUF4276 family protein n=1 Tax=Quadrisphaera sp. DSM 44207 TaxID=1881057 RepID=UPI001C40923B|nr:DUF4276 family protein [Quadrisphaera sp. DSM 44207]